MKIVLASHNQGKVRELSALLKNSSFQLISAADLGVQEPEETGLTFIENALLKARHACQCTNLPALADDSGLVVEALQGAPGIYSARYAGTQASATDNIKKLLTELQDTPIEKRHAYFYCVLVYLTHANDPAPLVCEGKWQGLILQQTKGQDGFGYDPVFYVPSEQKSAAELPLEIKNRISHRGQALQKLLAQLMVTTP